MLELQSGLEGKTRVVFGAAGFVGSRLCDRLLDAGAIVIGDDTGSTGRMEGVDHLDSVHAFTLVDHDVTTALRVDGPVD
jgi:nucleoside-diphosphate-sugar epimerase